MKANIQVEKDLFKTSRLRNKKQHKNNNKIKIIRATSSNKSRINNKIRITLINNKVTRKNPNRSHQLKKNRMS